MDRIEKAVHLFKKGSNCAQSLLSSYADCVGIDQEFAFRLGSGLGGGLGRKQYICGAVNAGALILSMKYGNNHADEKDKNKESYKQVELFISKMEEELDYIDCSRLLNVDILSKEGMKKAKELHLFKEVCPTCIRAVARYLKTNLDI
jgi:C_GCAxxG_C_C family probable redox protein